MQESWNTSAIFLRRLWKNKILRAELLWILLKISLYEGRSCKNSKVNYHHPRKSLQIHPWNVAKIVAKEKRASDFLGSGILLKYVKTVIKIEKSGRSPRSFKNLSSRERNKKNWNCHGGFLIRVSTGEKSNVTPFIFVVFFLLSLSLLTLGSEPIPREKTILCALVVGGTEGKGCDRMLSRHPLTLLIPVREKACSCAIFSDPFFFLFFFLFSLSLSVTSC